MLLVGMLIGGAVGAVIGVGVMCLMQINKA
jgi:hypothetical protein